MWGGSEYLEALACELVASKAIRKEGESLDLRADLGCLSELPEGGFRIQLNHQIITADTLVFKREGAD